VNVAEVPAEDGASMVTWEQAEFRHHSSFALEPELSPDIVTGYPGTDQKDTDEVPPIEAVLTPSEPL